MARERARDRKFWGNHGAYSEAFAEAAMKRFESHQSAIRESRRHFRMQRSWRLYYARGRGGQCDETEITLDGDKGEVLRISTGRYRRNIQDFLSLVMQTPPDFEPMALNTDPESQAQCAISIGILDWYKRYSHLAEVRVERSEIASVLGECVQHVRWDPELGEEALASGDGSKVAAYQGDFVFSTRTPYEYAYDRTSPDRRRPRWWIVNEPANRWDLIEKYGSDKSEAGLPLRDAILDLPPWTSMAREWGYEQTEYEFDDSVAVYHVYIEPSPACPDGRKAQVIDGRHVLTDGPLGEDRPGVFRMAPSEVIFRNEGTTSNFHALGLQDAHSSHVSMVLSNQDAFGLQRISAAKAAGVQVSRIGRGLGLVEYTHFDHKTGSPVPPPGALELLKTPQEIFTFIDLLGAEIDLVQGGSPVTRGDPSASKGDSGSKSAMLFAAAQAVSNGGLQACLQVDEEVATFLISSLRRHATVPRITTIAGKRNQVASQEFVGKDLTRVNRVIVRQAHPARDTFAGRMELAQLLSGKPVEEQERITSLIYTGRLETQTDDIEHPRLSIERENEALRDPMKPMPTVLRAENHLEHFEAHNRCAQSWEIRQNPALVERFEQHMLKHAMAMRPQSPEDLIMLAMSGQKPMPGSPAMAGPGAGPGGPPGPQAGPPGPPQAGPDAPVTRPETGEPGMPNMPNMPNMPRNPATGERQTAPQPAVMPEPRVGPPQV